MWGVHETLQWIAGHQPSCVAAAMLLLGACVVWLAVLQVRLSAVTRVHRGLVRSGEWGALAGMAEASEDAARARELAEELAPRCERLAEGQQRCLQRVGLVRFDAFGDVGGAQSWTVALLDGKQDGVVLTHLHGRQRSQGYAKPVSGGESSQALSEEERQALAQALRGAREAAR